LPPDPNSLVDPNDLVDPDAPLPGPLLDPRGLAAVAGGGFLGTLARYGVDKGWAARPGGFPLATFAINVTGALAIAVLLVVILERRQVNRYLRPFLATGILGGWTTMSTLTVDTSTLARHGHLIVAAAYLGATLVASLAGATAGATLARRWGGKVPAK
jgi:fluoride exporter